MNANSHRQIGLYLKKQYMLHIPQRYIHAFLLGCIEPDKNPTTYLKGSVRSQWLRGHNWGNSQKYIKRISRRLEQKQLFKLLDFYNLGKLIHYTADAFTYAHNRHFLNNLRAHREYESKLDGYLGHYLSELSDAPVTSDDVITALIRKYRLEYIRTASGICTDTVFALRACCAIIVHLSGKFSLYSAASLL